MDQTNPPKVKNPLLQQAIRYKGMMETGFSVETSEVPAQVAETILVLENEINTKKKKEQEKIRQKMKQNSGQMQRGI